MALLSAQKSRSTRLLAAIAALVALLLALAPAGVSAERPGAAEYRVKAAFLYNFAKFVKWPGTTEEVCVGVLGGDPFGEALEKTFQGKTVKGRPIVIRRAVKVKELLDCQIVFVSAENADRYAELAGAFDSSPVLTIGDDLDFARAGGVAGFYMERGRVRFGINLASVESSGLQVSSQLLGLAKIVEPGGD